MAWIILGGLVVIALVANEIRLAPEQDDNYEVRLREHYRCLKQEEDAVKWRHSREHRAA